MSARGSWAGLLVSGALLRPHLADTVTQIKMAAVLLIAGRALAAGVVSQLAWWTAILIGWRNSTI